MHYSSSIPLPISQSFSPASPVHVEEDVASGLSLLPYIFLHNLTHYCIIVRLPALITDGTHVTDVMPCSNTMGCE